MNKKRTAALSAGAVAILLAGSALAAESTQKYDLKGFTGIEVDGHVEMEVKVGKKFYVEVSGRERDMENLIVEVEDGTLRIYKKRGRRGGWFRDRSRELNAVIHLPKLNSVEIDGMSDAKISNIDSDKFSLDIDGHGDLTLTGKCGRADIEIDGHADIDARDFKCEDVVLDVDGHGNIELFAGKTLSIDINGHGDVEVYGNPRLKKFRTSGMGRFEIK